MDTVIAMALIAASNPIRLGIALLLISRPRPMLNLFTFWSGAMTMATAAGLGVLTVMHRFNPTFMQSISAQAADSDAQNTQIAVGLTILAVMALIALVASVRRARVPVPSGGPPTEAPPTDRPGAFVRLRDRVLNVLKGDYLWVAFVVGLGSGFPAIEYLIALAAIAASGQSIGIQVGVVMMFVVVMLWVIEIPLLSYSAAPAHTHAFMVRLHDWAFPRRWRIIATLVAAEAVFLVARGLAG
jgi:Sap, sulfolipid-1-addressing protein